MLKTYFTKCLTETTSFEEASTYCKEIRQVYCQEPGRFEFPLTASTSSQQKCILLCPLVYRYFREMGAPSVLSIKARNLIYCVLIKKERNDMDLENKTREYLDAFHSFETEDRKELQEQLFSTLWELTTTTSFLSTESPLFSNVQHLLSKMNLYIDRFQWRKEYEEYLAERRTKEQLRVYEIMERAFWDQMESHIQNKEYRMVEDCLKELFHLLKDIPHPHVVDYEGYLEDLLEIHRSCFSKEEENRQKIFSIFQPLFQYMKEADSKEFEVLYDKLLQQLETHSLDSSFPLSQFIVFALQNTYTMIYQLKAKINFYIKEKKNG